MSQTANYNLYITGDNDNPKFKDFRKELCGNENSNMVKIDAALATKANSSTSETCTLLASAWVGADTPFTQEIVIDGLGAAQNGAISIAHNATIDQRDAARCAMLSVTGQSAGKIVISADGELPEIDIPVIVILFG